jgi:hypothetical protein
MSRITTLAFACTLAAGTAAAQMPPSISFQGMLSDVDGVASADPVDIVFSLYVLENAAVALWSETQSVEPSETGTFSVLLGSVVPLDAAYFSQPLWLGVTVGLDEEMAPRLQLATVPYAFRAASAAEADHATAADTANALGTITETDITDLQAEVLLKANGAELCDDDNATTPANWADLANVPPGLDNGDDDTQLTEIQVETYVTNAAIDLAAGSTIGGAVLAPASELMDGSAATTPVAWAGITGVPAPTYDLDVAGSLRCSGLRVEPNATSPKVVGGHSANVVDAGAVGGTIGGGGGATTSANHVSDNYGTVGGGIGNTAGSGAGAQYATVGGGRNNTASGMDTTIAGGNTNSASAQASTVCGGWSNTATNLYATAAGG